MKKLLTAIFVFLSLFTLGLSLEVKVEAATLHTDTLTANLFKATNTTYTDFSGVSGESGAVYAGKSAKTNRGTIQLRSDKSDSGIVTTTSGGYVKKIVVTWDSNTATGRTLDVYGNNNPYSSAADLYATGGNSNQGEELGSIVCGTSTELIITNSYKYVGLRSNKNAMYIDKIEITWEEAAAVTSYSITFNANGGTFAEGKGADITASIGTDTKVKLPTSADLKKTLYETETKYTTLKGWSDGTTTYDPGDTLTVSSGKTFTAVYETTDKINSVISIEEALKICQLTGSTKTIYKFKVSGKINEIGTEYSEQYKNITVTITDGTNNLMLYRLSGGADLTIGDEIIATGELKKFNSTSEMDAGCTYVISSKVECANFIKTVTKSSLIVSYNDELNPTNVDLRLGGKITDDSYLSNATYGVLVKEGSVVLTAGKTTYATVEEFIAANQGFKNVTCSPVQVNESGVEDANGTYYQFAWVLTDMEGHYDTTLTAVMYMIYDGTLYICNAKTTSVLSTVAQYLDLNNNFEFTEEQKTVLNNIKA